MRKNDDDMISILISKIEKLEGKVDLLFSDRATRSDIENLRKEIQTSYVTRVEYDTRHNEVVRAQAVFESDFNRVRGEIYAEFQKISDRNERSKQQMEDRFREERDAGISSKERIWMRIGVLVSALLSIIALISLFIDHIQLH